MNGTLLENSRITLATFGIVAGAILGGGVWVGAIAQDVENVKKAVEIHEGRPAHTTTIQDVATIKAAMQNNVSNIEEIKRDLKELRAKSEQDKQEILEAIRNQ